MMNVLLQSTPVAGDTFPIGPHIVAAYLNAASGLNSNPSVLTQAQIISMFNAWSTSPTLVYHPTAGVNWYAADIVNYLKSTMV